jgi:hypothetical protein
MLVLIRALQILAVLVAIAMAFVVATEPLQNITEKLKDIAIVAALIAFAYFMQKQINKKTILFSIKSRRLSIAQAVLAIFAVLQLSSIMSGNLYQKIAHTITLFVFIYLITFLQKKIVKNNE